MSLATNPSVPPKRSSASGREKLSSLPPSEKNPDRAASMSSDCVCIQIEGEVARQPRFTPRERAVAATGAEIGEDRLVRPSVAVERDGIGRHIEEAHGLREIARSGEPGVDPQGGAHDGQVAGYEPEIECQRSRGTPGPGRPCRRRSCRWGSGWRDLWLSTSPGCWCQGRSGFVPSRARSSPPP